MKWIKLSDRPWDKLDGDLIVRTVKEKIRIDLDNVKWRKPNSLHCDFDGAHGWYIKDIPFENVEWLDESQPQPSSDQIAGMRKDMDMALEREKELIAALENLIEAIPKQNNDRDWWPDNLTEAYDKACSVITLYNSSYNQPPQKVERKMKSTRLT